MKRIVFILVLAIMGLSALANSETYLNFVKKDGSVTQFVAVGTKLTFSGNTINVNSKGVENKVSMVGLHHLEFGKNALPSDIKGDVNGDGVVDVSDINALIDIILGNAQPSDYKNPYVNDDDIVDIADVSLVINAMLGV